MLDIIIFAAIAIFLIFRLKSILGEKNGDERKRQNPFTPTKEEVQEQVKKIVKLKTVQKMGQQDKETSVIRGKSEAESAYPITLNAGMNMIQEADPYFSEHKFTSGLKQAYVMVMEAYANGDYKTLKMLLSPALFETFSKSIEARAEKGQRYEVHVNEVTDIELQKADLVDNIASITARITSEQSSALYDQNGKMLEGDPNKFEEIEDVWVLKRDVSQSDPNWMIIEVSES